MISMEQFLLRQPSMPEETETDKFYFDICVSLAEIAKKMGLFPSYPEKVVERAALVLIGYYQDVISDAGVWRSFIDECRRMYGFPVPFFTKPGEDYFDYELNKADVFFMVWYALSMNYENRRVCNPLDREILEGAKKWYQELERHYEEAPIPVGYRFSAELEIHNEEDRPEIMRLANWLFLHCYLMTPAFALTLSEIANDYDLSKEEGLVEMQKRLDAAMWQDPTGPLALYLGEWLYLIVEGKPAPEPKIDNEKNSPHKYYTAFTEFTGGKKLAFFATYKELNEFFIRALGWAEGEEHLSQVKNDRDFVLMVDSQKGMLLARNVARCIAAPDNKLYDQEYARLHAMELLTERGLCPGDLLKLICKEGWLPDAHFPDSIDYKLVEDNNDFIARCYLQAYYRGD
ncbi:MAG: DUF3843 family protein [Muribaculaceae bacterium]|nr:DUF3843 family protein [Muribaculaceae bacterium]